MAPSLEAMYDRPHFLFMCAPPLLHLIQLLALKCHQLSQPHFGAKCENATHTPKDGKMESSTTPKNSEDDLRGQISSPRCILYINGKLLKRKCPKLPRIAHLDI